MIWLTVCMCCITWKWWEEKGRMNVDRSVSYKKWHQMTNGILLNLDSKNYWLNILQKILSSKFNFLSQMKYTKTGWILNRIIDIKISISFHNVILFLKKQTLFTIKCQVSKKGSKQVHEKHSKKWNLGYIHHPSAAAAM